MPTILGVNCFLGGAAETLEKQGRKISGNKSIEKFAEKFGNVPKIRQTKIKTFTPNPLCRTSGSRNVISKAMNSETFMYVIFSGWSVVQ